MAHLFLWSEEDGEAVAEAVTEAFPDLPLRRLREDPARWAPHLLMEGDADAEWVFSGPSEGAQTLRSKIVALEESEEPLLLYGEAGSGKGKVAQALHGRSGRSDGPFVRLACAALPANLLYGELFGHRAGAYRGAVRDWPGRVQEAEGGTLYLDGLDKIPEGLLDGLLRLITTGTYAPLGAHEVRSASVRVIMAVDRDSLDPTETVAHQGLAEALTLVRLPPIRERRADLPALAQGVLTELGQRRGRPMRLAPSAVVRLQRHELAGNLMELENLLEQALWRTEGDVVEDGHLPTPRLDIGEGRWRDLEGAWAGVQREARAWERALLESALRQCPQLSIPELAELLGTTARVLDLRMSEWGLTR